MRPRRATALAGRRSTKTAYLGSVREYDVRHRARPDLRRLGRRRTCIGGRRPREPRRSARKATPSSAAELQRRLSFVERKAARPGERFTASCGHAPALATVPEVRAADHHAGRRHARRQRRDRHLLLLARNQGPPGCAAGREGGKRGLQDRPVRARHRQRHELDRAAAHRRGRRARPAPARVHQAAAPGPGDHRGRLDRSVRPRAAAHLAPGDGLSRQQHRHGAAARVRARAGRHLLRPGLLSQGHRAVHDDRAAGRQRRRRDGRRGQPQVRARRRLGHQDRPGRLGLCRRRHRHADSPSGHQPGPEEVRPERAAAGRGARPCRARRARRWHAT